MDIQSAEINLYISLSLVVRYRAQEKYFAMLMFKVRNTIWMGTNRRPQHEKYILVDSPKVIAINLRIDKYRFTYWHNQ